MRKMHKTRVLFPTEHNTFSGLMLNTVAAQYSKDSDPKWEVIIKPYYSFNLFIPDCLQNCDGPVVTTKG